MSCICSNHTLNRRKRTGDHDKVRLRSTREKVNGCIRAMNSFSDQVGCFFTPFIFTVSSKTIIIDSTQRLQNLRMGTVIVIIIKTYHN